MRVKSILLALAAALCFQACKEDKAAIQQSCVPLDLQDGLIAFYPFSQGSLEDEVGGNDLSNNTAAMPGEDRAGNEECAFAFDNSSGTGQFLSTEASSFLDGLGTFSVSLWYYPENEEREGGRYELLAGRGADFNLPGYGNEWTIGLYDCRKVLFMHGNRGLWDSLLANGQSCEEIVRGQTGKWHHLVVTFDNGDLQIYKNGILDLNQNHTLQNATAQDIGDFMVGAGFTGRIDDILIYNRVLSQGEVDDLKAMPACCQ